MKKKVVDLVLFAGQSNMAGRGVSCEAWPAKSPVLTEGAGWEYRAISAPGQLFEIAEPFGRDENNPDGICDVWPGDIKVKSGSMVTAFVNAYFEKNGVPVIGVSASRGGSWIAQWQTGAEHSYIDDARDRFLAARKYLEQEGFAIRRSFVLWCQGESDGDNGTTVEEYVTLFGKMWDVLRPYCSDLFMVRIGKCNIPGSYDRYEGIRTAQGKILEQVEGVHEASDLFYGMWEQGLMKDTFHYYQEGYNRVGKDAGENVARFFENAEE